MRAAAALAMALLVVSVCPLAAQGQGQGQGRGGPPPDAGRGGRNGIPPPGNGRASAPTSVTERAARSFGTWSDDSYVLPPGEAWLGVSAGYWRLPFADQTDAPIFDLTVGLAPRLHVGVTLPVSSLTPVGGSTTDRFLGDTYLSAKIGLRDGETGFGVAVAPLLEILADGSWPGPDGSPIGRVHWGLPVNLELKSDRWRAYGSVGYLSRGAVFGTGTLDVVLGARGGLLVMLSEAYSTAAAPVELSSSRTRTDLNGGGYALLSPAVSAYALIGRTISKVESDTSSLAISAGLSFRLHAPARASEYVDRFAPRESLTIP